MFRCLRVFTSVWMVFLCLPLLAEDTGMTGGNQSHYTLQPSLSMNYIIALEGVFPSRSRGEPQPAYGGGEQFLGEIRIFAGNYAPGGWAMCQGQLLPITGNEALFSLLGTIYGGDAITTFALPDLRGRAAVGFDQGPGLTRYMQGEQAGQTYVTPNTTQMAAHTHTHGATSTNSSGGGLSFENRQPVLAVNYIFPLEGLFYYLHEVRMFGGNFAPRSWAMAQGQLLPISSYNAVFAQVGCVYGGDCISTFALPDLRSRVAVSEGTGPGLSPWNKGQMAGSETTTMTVSTLPSHAHTTSTGDTGYTGGSQAMNNVQPSLGLRYFIATTGYYPSRDTGNITTDPMLGEIRLFAGNQMDSSWAACEGQLLSIADNTALFSLLGTIYGGDGITTFALPDLRGRTPLGLGQGPGLPNYPQGYATGIETFTLNTTTLPSHAHALPATFPGTAGNGSLNVSNNGDGTLDLTWGGICGTANTGYAVYEGTLGDFSSHSLVSGTCDQAGGFLYSHTPGSGNRYFLISATDSGTSEEGPLGTNSTGSNRPNPAATCMTSVNTTSCDP